MIYYKREKREVPISYLNNMKLDSLLRGRLEMVGGAVNWREEVVAMQAPCTIVEAAHICFEPDIGHRGDIRRNRHSVRCK